MNYPLEDLLYIRKLREDAASDNLQKAKNHYEEAIRKVEQKKKELEDFKVWRKEEEDRLLNELIDKKIKKADIDTLKLEFAKLKQKELDHVHAIDKAKEEREEAKKSMEEARVLYQQALINRQKIDEHKATWVAEWNKEQQRLADIEMEEFRTKENEQLFG